MVYQSGITFKNPYNRKRYNFCHSCSVFLLLLSRSWVCLIILLSCVLCLCETFLDKTYEKKEFLSNRNCHHEHIVVRFETASDISCVYHCSRQFNTTDIFFNVDIGVCSCCSAQLYTVQDMLPIDEGAVYFTIPQDIYTDCVHAQTEGITTSGVFKVKTPLTNKTIRVYCDMDTHDGGWLVFQQRFDGSVEFYHNFTEYEEGFGHASSEHWLGLKYLYEFASDTGVLLYLKFVDVHDTEVYEYFSGFRLDPGPEYAFYIQNYIEANDGTEPPSYDGSFATTRWYGFSAADVERDINPDNHCAQTFKAGWWFRFCSYMNPNGLYIEPGTMGDRTSFSFESWKGYEGMKASRFMIKKP